MAGSALAFGPWAFAGIRVSQPFKPFTIAVAAFLLFCARGTAWRQAWRARSTTAFYGAGMAGCYLLALGPEPRLWGHRLLYKAPYAWLMALPGFDSIRVPARFAWLGLLCLAVLVALVYARRRSRLLCTALAVGIIADGLTVSRFLAVPAAGPAGAAAGAAAILELPLRAETDAPALYRSIRYRRPLVNGTSGYYPPHYWALTEALAAGDLSVLDALSVSGPLAIAVDRAAPEAAALEAALRQRMGISETMTSAAWASFVVRPQPRAGFRPGRALILHELRASISPEELWRLHDGRIETAWSSGLQKGDEQIDVELEPVSLVGAVVLRFGSCPFGFPRELTVTTSPDGSTWTEAFRGPTAAATVWAAIEDPANVPLAVPVGPVTARFIRLRQTGQAPRVPWCVSELSVHQP